MHTGLGNPYIALPARAKRSRTQTMSKKKTRVDYANKHPLTHNHLASALSPREQNLRAKTVSGTAAPSRAGNRFSLTLSTQQKPKPSSLAIQILHRPAKRRFRTAYIIADTSPCSD